MEDTAMQKVHSQNENTWKATACRVAAASARALKRAARRLSDGISSADRYYLSRASDLADLARRIALLEREKSLLPLADAGR